MLPMAGDASPVESPSPRLSGQLQYHAEALLGGAECRAKSSRKSLPPASRPAREEATNFTPSRIEGEGEFRMGDETRQVEPGDFIFIPKNTLHGRVRTSTPSMSTLSIYAPFFDRKKENVVWAEEE